MKSRVGAVLAAVTMLVVAASPTYAQGITGGVKVGVNFADLSLDAPGDADLGELGELDDLLGNRTGFVAGGFVDVPFTPQVSFAPEVLFTQKGARTEILDNSVAFELTQLQIPLLFKANFVSGPVRPFVAVGPAFGFNTSTKLTTEIGGDKEEVDFDDETEGIEYSLVVGGGVKFGQASVELRYDLGLSNLSSSETGDIKSRTFSILFGFGWSR
jgi:hypothetical protein